MSQPSQFTSLTTDLPPFAMICASPFNLRADDQTTNLSRRDPNNSTRRLNSLSSSCGISFHQGRPARPARPRFNRARGSFPWNRSPQSSPVRPQTLSPAPVPLLAERRDFGFQVRFRRSAIHDEHERAARRCARHLRRALLSICARSSSCEHKTIKFITHTRVTPTFPRRLVLRARRNSFSSRPTSIPCDTPLAAELCESLYS